jgi:hypothetical protein
MLGQRIAGAERGREAVEAAIEQRIADILIGLGAQLLCS